MSSRVPRREGRRLGMSPTVVPTRIGSLLSVSDLGQNREVFTDHIGNNRIDSSSAAEQTQVPVEQQQDCSRLQQGTSAIEAVSESDTYPSVCSSQKPSLFVFRTQEEFRSSRARRCRACQTSGYEARHLRTSGSEKRSLRGSESRVYPAITRESGKRSAATTKKIKKKKLRTSDVPVYDRVAWERAGKPYLEGNYLLSGAGETSTRPEIDGNIRQPVIPDGFRTDLCTESSIPAAPGVHGEPRHPTGLSPCSAYNDLPPLNAEEGDVSGDRPFSCPERILALDGPPLASTFATDGSPSNENAGGPDVSTEDATPRIIQSPIFENISNYDSRPSPRSIPSPVYQEAPSPGGIVSTDDNNDVVDSAALGHWTLREKLELSKICHYVDGERRSNRKTFMNVNRWDFVREQLAARGITRTSSACSSMWLTITTKWQTIHTERTKRSGRGSDGLDDDFYNQFSEFMWKNSQKLEPRYGVDGGMGDWTSKAERPRTITPST